MCEDAALNRVISCSLCACTRLLHGILTLVDLRSVIMSFKSIKYAGICLILAVSFAFWFTKYGPIARAVANSARLFSGESAALPTRTPALAVVTTSRARVSSWQRRLPSCVIVGVRKCGTRALLEYLSKHPGVVTANHEVAFFTRDHVYARGLDYYRSQMPTSLQWQHTIEKTPGYFDINAVTSRIRKMNSSVKIIIIVREPVSRLVSEYTDKARRAGKNNARTFEVRRRTYMYVLHQNSLHNHKCLIHFITKRVHVYHCKTRPCDRKLPCS